MGDHCVQRDCVLEMGSRLCAMSLYCSCVVRVVSVRDDRGLSVVVVLLLLHGSVLFFRDRLAHTRTLLINHSRVVLSFFISYSLNPVCMFIAEASNVYVEDEVVICNETTPTSCARFCSTVGAPDPGSVAWTYLETMSKIDYSCRRTT